MLTRQRIVTFGIPTMATATLVAAALLTTGAKTVKYSEPMQPIESIPSFTGADGHQIDVVFAVDTTGSMGGLLDGAKQTVWSIASHIKQVDPDASIRIGLVAYKDVGDEYITKPFKLTTDLDAMYAELMSYTAAGGGDTPENVDAALNDALHTMQWRTGAKKMVFVVGDAPPASRGDVPRFDVLARQASESGITINTIRCGVDSNTQLAFSRIAELGGGEFSTIEQDGGVQKVATPYDDRINTIQAEIDGTNVIYGDDGVRARYEAKMASGAAAAPAAKADRAAYYTKGGYKAADDLVGGFADGTVAIESVDPAALPEPMRGKDKAEIKAELESRVAKRKQLTEQAQRLAKQREDYLKNNADAGEGFDTKVKATVERQLKK
jgi:von Willebrand factor type A domain-containing protein